MSYEFFFIHCPQQKTERPQKRRDTKQTEGISKSDGRAAIVGPFTWNNVASTRVRGGERRFARTIRWSQ